MRGNKLVAAVILKDVSGQDCCFALIMATKSVKLIFTRTHLSCSYSRKRLKSVKISRFFQFQGHAHVVRDAQGPTPVTVTRPALASDGVQSRGYSGPIRR